MELVFEQFYDFAIMFVFGLILGAGFDIYQHIAATVKNRVLLNTMDIMAGIIAGMAAFAVLIYANWGAFRFYIVIAIFSGIICYFTMRKKLYPGK